ncbi:MAG: hypothetical protein M3069_28720 [Chloroflexota bacterium]|nr:hypothetical protein [Chloroflexota bacterium]
MLRDLSIAVSPLLALLLVLLTPVGTRQGGHRDQLLDPIFPHVHFAGERTSAQSAAPKAAQRGFEAHQQGPVFGAGAGASSAFPSLGLTPPLPRWSVVLPSGGVWRSIVRLGALPRGTLTEPPPDPPPTPL